MAEETTADNNNDTQQNLWLMNLKIHEVDQAFDDVQPIPQDDGPSKVCCIDYPPNFVKVYDYFRAILKSNEISPRVLGLTGLCLDQNPSNYTVWHVRRQCLLPMLTDKSKSDDDKDALLKNELKFTAELGGTNPKSYQVWYHRRGLLELLPPHAALQRFAQFELDYIATVLTVDGKNYHAWSHRQWLVLTLNQPDIYDSELQYTAELIVQDIRNNSAWNHRWLIVHNPQNTTQLPDAVVESEATYTLAQVQREPYNESSCRYLVALLKEQAKQQSPPILKHCLETLQVTVDKYRDASATLSACADLYELDAQFHPASAALQALVSVDPIRTKYWNWRLEQIAGK